MNRRHLISAALVFCVLGGGAIGSADAKDAGFDGTWTGVTAKGGDIVLTVSGGQVSYVFRGASVPINSASISGKTLTLSVGTLQARVSVTRTGPATANYSYSDPNGGSAAAVLTRR